MQNDSRIIVALDGMNADEIIRFQNLLAGKIAGVKFNDALDRRAEQYIHQAKSMGFLVMTDPKLHDIPNTVANRMKNFADMGADWVTVHASGGVEMMQAAVKATAGSSTGVIAVTVLTSLSIEDCTRTYGSPTISKVKELARSAAAAGVLGIVCSPVETWIVDELGYPLTIITPGIRPAGTDPNDQQRPATPAIAIANGADYLVVGRPITKAADPVAATEAINEEVAAALAR